MHGVVEMGGSINLVCGPQADLRTLTISIPENKNPLNTILVGFTGGIDSSLLLYLLVKLNREQQVPYIIQPITVNSALGSSGPPINEQWHCIPRVIEFVKNRHNHLINESMFLPGNPSLTMTQQTLQIYNQITKNNKNKLLFVGDTEHPAGMPVGYSRNFAPNNKKIMQPFKNLNKSHIVDAISKLDLEEIIDIVPICLLTHKYKNSPCYNFFCNERRWAYRILNRNDLIEKFVTLE